jgi:hypothetical protein
MAYLDAAPAEAAIMLAVAQTAEKVLERRSLRAVGAAFGGVPE